MKALALSPVLLLAACSPRNFGDANVQQALCHDLSPLPPAGMPNPGPATHTICPAAGPAARVGVYGKDGCQLPADQGGWSAAGQKVGQNANSQTYRRQFAGKFWQWVYFYTEPTGWGYVPEQDLAAGATGECAPGNANGGGVPVAPLNPGSGSGGLSLTAADKTALQLNNDVKGFSVVRGWTRDHMAIDLGLPGSDVTGRPVHAIGIPGKKVYVWCWNDSVGGNQAMLLGEGMEYAFNFSRLSECRFLNDRSGTVMAGEKIGAMGNTGPAVASPHLHFEQWKLNSPIDPGTLSAQRGHNQIMDAAQVMPVWKKFAEMAVAP